MGNRRVIVVDAGTTKPRVLLYDESRRSAAEAAGAWRFSTPADGPSLAREFDPGWLKAAVFDLVASCIRDSGVAPADIDVIAVTSQRQAVAFLDADGGTIYIGPNTDLRAVFEGAAIDEEMGELVYETTGHLPSMLLAPAKLSWFKTNQPDAYDRISRVVSLADWIASALGGEMAAEATLAGEAGLLDIRSRTRCGSLLDDLGLNTVGAPLVESGSIVGAITQDAANSTGLRPGTPVVAAGADTQCGLIGLGAARAGQAGIVAGWSVPVQLLTGRPVLSPERKTWAGFFQDPSLWTLESTAGDAGNSYRWLADLLFQRASFDEMDRLAGGVARGSEGATALLGPSRMDVSRLGMRQGGLLFPVPLTVSGLGRPQIIRSALEALAYAIRSNLEQAERLAGAGSDSVAIGGGLTRSSTLIDIVVDVLGRQVMVAPHPNVSALGAFLNARTGLGDFGSIGEAASEAERGLRSVDPDPVAGSEYGELYESWLQTQERIKALGL